MHTAKREGAPARIPSIWTGAPISPPARSRAVNLHRSDFVNIGTVAYLRSDRRKASRANGDSVPASVTATLRHAADQSTAAAELRMRTADHVADPWRAICTSLPAVAATRDLQHSGLACGQFDRTLEADGDSNGRRVTSGTKIQPRDQRCVDPTKATRNWLQLFHARVADRRARVPIPMRPRARSARCAPHWRLSQRLTLTQDSPGGSSRRSPILSNERPCRGRPAPPAQSRPNW
jgi:hypothetical protein